MLEPAFICLSRFNLGRIPLGKASDGVFGLLSLCTICCLTFFLVLRGAVGTFMEKIEKGLEERISENQEEVDDGMRFEA
jgi:hypothetical protein